MIDLILYTLAAIGGFSITFAVGFLAWYWVNTKSIRKEHRKQKGWKL